MQQRLLHGFLGSFVAVTVVLFAVVVGFLAIALPGDGSASLPGVVDLHQDDESLSMELGPLFILLPTAAAVVLAPLAASMLSRWSARRSRSTS